MITKALPGRGTAPNPVGLEVQCRYATKVALVLNYPAVAASIRCEAGAMARRPAPPAGLIRGVAPLWHMFESVGVGFLSVHAEMEGARGRIRQHLPRGWDSMSDAERQKVIREEGSGAPQGASSKQSFVLRPVHRLILESLKGAAMKSPLLERETKLEHSQMMRALKRLREEGLVEHRHGLGYYRPDSPRSGPHTSGGATE